MAEKSVITWLDYFRRNVLNEIKENEGEVIPYVCSAIEGEPVVRLYTANYNQGVVRSTPYHVSLGEYGIYVNGGLMFSN